MSTAIVAIFVIALGITLIFMAAKVVELVLFGLGLVLRFFLHTLRDAGRLLGHLISFLVLCPLTLLNALFLNKKNLANYFVSMSAEVRGFFMSLWKLSLGNLLNIFNYDPFLASEETTIPPLEPARPAQGFSGYKIVGTLPGGGSGAKLYIAKPNFAKSIQLQEAGFPPVAKVVLKSFALSGGPSLPQIMRESRSLEIAKRLGFVLEHGTDEKHFWYAMPYVPGDNLAVVSKRMHQARNGQGLESKALKRGLSYVSDILLALEKFHLGGLWHKDVKPENVVVCDDRAFLVDLGLVTSLASSATLTTHGTEYFRDPELVRMAMQGIKVRDVDAVKFDLYGAGAVLYSIVEGDFPAHGGLSSVSRPCPDALKWVIRRAMADLPGRYGSSREMLLDLHKVLESDDPFTLKPADLPSMGGVAPLGVAEQAAPIQEYRPIRNEPGTGGVSSSDGAIATLEIMGGAQNGKLFPLRAGRYIVGRSSHCDITIEGSAISNRHMQLVVAPNGEVKFKDIGSRNGIWLGGVKKSKGIWRSGHQLKLGKLVLGLHGMLTDGQTADVEEPVENNSRRKLRVLVVLLLLCVFIPQKLSLGFDNIGACHNSTVRSVVVEAVDLSKPDYIPGGEGLAWGRKDLRTRIDFEAGALDDSGGLLVVDDISAFGTPRMRNGLIGARTHIGQELELCGDWGDGKSAYQELVAQLRAAVGSSDPSARASEVGDILVANSSFGALLWLQKSSFEKEDRVDVLAICASGQQSELILKQLNLD